LLCRSLVVEIQHLFMSLLIRKRENISCFHHRYLNPASTLLHLHVVLHIGSKSSSQDSYNLHT
jgi:hypothetical protein